MLRLICSIGQRLVRLIFVTGMAASGVNGEGRSIFIPASDGLRLHVREYRSAAGIPVVCLPGLARTTDDFDALAAALVYGERPRRVIAIDSRGRGKSEYDPDPQNYNVAVELADVVTALAALQIRQAVFVGSSRGSILTMLLAAAQPGAIAGARSSGSQSKLCHPSRELRS